MCLKPVIRVELRNFGAAAWNDAGFLTELKFDGSDDEGDIFTNCKDTYLTPKLGVHLE
jgi:hypothetical protein